MSTKPKPFLEGVGGANLSSSFFERGDLPGGREGGRSEIARTIRCEPGRDVLLKLRPCLVKFAFGFAFVFIFERSNVVLQLRHKASLKGKGSHKKHCQRHNGPRVITP